MLHVATLVIAIALAGCASTFPKETLRDVNRSLSVAELRRAPEAYLNEKVMLGGEILATRPKVGETEIEVLSRPLGDDERPDRTDRSGGRFLIRTQEFLDPAVYANGRRITVVGRVAGAEERPINELPYRYPVISADQLRLWSREAVSPYPYPRYQFGFGFGHGPFFWRYGRPYPYYYDPFYDPFWW